MLVYWLEETPPLCGKRCGLSQTKLANVQIFPSSQVIRIFFEIFLIFWVFFFFMFSSPTLSFLPQSQFVTTTSSLHLICLECVRKTNYYCLSLWNSVYVNFLEKQHSLTPNCSYGRILRNTNINPKLRTRNECVFVQNFGRKSSAIAIRKAWTNNGNRICNTLVNTFD